LNGFFLLLLDWILIESFFYIGVDLFYRLFFANSIILRRFIDFCD
jgi:hypothetical protein